MEKTLKEIAKELKNIRKELEEENRLSAVCEVDREEMIERVENLARFIYLENTLEN